MGALGVKRLRDDKSSRLAEAALSVAIAFDTQTHNCHS